MQEDIKQSNVNTKTIIIIVFVIILMVVGFYFVTFTNFNNFHYELSKDNGVWGTFGDYIGGILNPIIAAFALYLIAETYKLQKIELEKTRELLKLSTDAQENQIKLAALTTLLNLNLTKISVLESKKISLLQGSLPEPKSPNKAVHQLTEALQKSSNTDWLAEKIKNRFIQIEDEIKKLEIENIDLENQIKYFLQSK